MMRFELRARQVFAVLAIIGALNSTQAEPITASFPRLGRVTASSGLTLRTSPKASAPSITVIPNGANVFVVRPTSQMDTIEGIKAPWLLISYEGQSGFVFSGFLSSDLQQPPDFTEEDATIIRRLTQLSGLRVPSIKVRYAMRGNPYVAEHFTLKDRRQLGSFIVAIIAPEQTDCQGFFDECFSLIGTTNGDYLFSDVDTPPMGPLYFANSRLAFFMQTEAEGDGCWVGGHSSEIAFSFETFSVYGRSVEGGGRCPTSCDFVKGCPVRLTETTTVKYFANGKETQASHFLVNLFKIAESERQRSH